MSRFSSGMHYLCHGGPNHGRGMPPADPRSKIMFIKLGLDQRVLCVLNNTKERKCERKQQILLLSYGNISVV